MNFVYIDRTPFEILLERLPGIEYLSYRLWHRRALQVARKLHEKVSFDLSHLVTFCGYREPGFMWKLDIPFVWGPVGGTQNFPWRFLMEAGLAGGLKETIRSVLNWFQLRFSRRVRQASHKATTFIAANTTIQRNLVAAGHGKPEVLPELGLAQIKVPQRTNPSRPGHLKILWSGHFQSFKALSLLIKALAILPPDVTYELRLVGDGPQKRRWQRMARKHNVDQHCLWTGWLPFAESLKQYAWADIFVFTSLRDTSGNVMLEALGSGLPVVGLDHQGVHDLVTDDCGIKIQVTRPKDVVENLSAAIIALVRDPSKRQQLSLGALKRAEEYLWPRQGEKMAQVYRSAIEQPPMPQTFSEHEEQVELPGYSLIT